MRTITVNTSKAYEITIGEGLLDQAGAILKKTSGGQAAVIITDDIVAELYAGRLANSLAGSGYRVTQYVIPHGEASKNGNNFLSILNFLAEKKITRKDLVLALGGGVVGDLAGFAAACYMRGIHFAQLPTTLLAAVDSSVGGKTAIDLAAGKNLAGAFYQPDAVICDISLLSTLTPQVYQDGCAEVIKTGAIADKVLFESFETPINTQLEKVIARCVEIKRDIVVEDEFETGARKLLNFGHTAGHAIELLSNYEITHGSAVSAGMAIITRAASRMGICDAQCARDILSMLKSYNLPVNTRYEAADLARACLSDKKRDGDRLTMVFPAKTGKCVLQEVRVDELENVLRLGLEAEAD
ncbi:MAG: 3-dehydroquinate synthase [Treponema sp.]|jgi:3-dehydroquinate synthase|nr:3-dehydroquinate synthase [Treponema sp.]